MSDPQRWAKMKPLLLITAVLLSSGCGRTFDAGPDSYYLKVLSDARTLAQAALLHEQEKSDTDGIVSIDEIFAAWPDFEKSGMKDRIRKQEIVYIPQRMPIDQKAIITITAVGDYVGVTRADMTTETFLKK